MRRYCPATHAGGPAAKNLSFGHGIHFCLGAHLAGQEVRAAIGGLLPYLDGLELTDAPLQRNPSALLNGWQRVELTWASIRTSAEQAQ
jgi:cytochrome P450